MNELTAGLIEDGAQLLRRLDVTGPVIDGACWFLFTGETEKWSLMLAVKGIQNTGPRVAYKTVQRALAKKPPLTELNLADVVLARPDSPLLMVLRSAVSTGGSGIAGIRFTNSVINGNRIRDAYVYRL